MDFVNRKYSEKYIRRKANQLTEDDWYCISKYQKLSEDFIRKYQNKVNWHHVSFYQKLSEYFIRKFQYKVDWGNISRCQDLSEDFIREFQNKIYWNNIRYNMKIHLSDKFCEDFDDKLYYYSNEWKINGRFHRTIGPAVIYMNGREEYWYRGEYLEYIKNMKQYKHWLNLRAFL